MRDALPSAERALRRCLVCGSSEVRTDEVEDRGWILLAECSRCDHRWTRWEQPGAAPAALPARPALCAAREVASAA